MAASSIREDVFNLPNMLTWARVFVIPVFMWLMYLGTPLCSMIAAVLFTLAAITDFVDGYLARRMGLESLTGKFLDPLADKLIVTAAMIMLVYHGDLQAWLVAIVLSREFAVTGLRAMAGAEGIVLKSRSSARLKTAFQLVGVLGMIIHYTYEIDWYVVSSPVNFHVLGYWFVIVSVWLGLWSGFMYFWGFIQGVGQVKAPAK